MVVLLNLVSFKPDPDSGYRKTGKRPIVLLHKLMQVFRSNFCTLCTIIRLISRCFLNIWSLFQQKKNSFRFAMNVLRKNFKCKALATVFLLRVNELKTNFCESCEVFCNRKACLIKLLVRASKPILQPELSLWYQKYMYCTKCPL